MLGKSRDRVGGRGFAPAASCRDRESSLLGGGDLGDVARGEAPWTKGEAAAVDYGGETEPPAGRTQQARQRAAHLPEPEQDDVGRPLRRRRPAADLRKLEGLVDAA